MKKNIIYLKRLLSELRIIALLVIFYGISVPNFVQAETIISHIEWNNPNHEISEDLTVDVGGVLTISAGTKINVLEGVSITILGDLFVNGTKDNPVTFEGLHSFVIEGSAQLKNTIIKDSLFGLESHNANITLRDVTMKNVGWCFSFGQNTKFNIERLVCDKQKVGSSIMGQSKGEMYNTLFTNMQGPGEVLGSYDSDVTIKDAHVEVLDKQIALLIRGGTSKIINSTFNRPESSGSVSGVTILKNSLKGLVVYEDSNVTMSSSTITQLGYGVQKFGGFVKIASSTLSHNDVAVFQTSLAQVRAEPYQIQTHDSGIGGDTSLGQINTDMALTGSRMLSNTLDIKNDIFDPINAEGVWWGSNVPKAEGLVSVANPLLIDPWSMYIKPECCSSVVFIPGFQASQLGKYDNDIDGSGYESIAKTSIDDVLWVPNNNGDVKELALSAIGNSVSPIRAFGILNTVYGKEYYAPLTQHLNSLVDSGSIASWANFPYDWRYSIFDITASSTENGLSKLHDLVIEQSQKSTNGKVVIIAHSNGGLVSKALIAQYPDVSGYIESVVYVGVPHAGTPKTISSLLHGAGESLLGGILMRAVNARDLGLTLPGAYGLLPHISFFASALKPVIEFSSSSKSFLGVDWNSIETESALDSFLTQFRTNVGNVRDLNAPSTLSTTHLEKVRFEQQRFVQNPEFRFNKYSIFGTGMPTIETLVYESKKDTCKITRLNKCYLENLITPNYRMSLMGDGTVLESSASKYGFKIPIDLISEAQNANENKIEHATLFKSPTILATISDIIKQTNTHSLTANIASVLQGTDRVQQRISIHSPVLLHVYDTDGNHTGPQIPQNGDLPEEFMFIDEEIPGSVYIDQGHKASIYLTKIEPITIELVGIDVGKFSLEIVTEVNDVVIEEQVYSDIPVVIGSQVQLGIEQNLVLENLQPKIKYLKEPILKIDIDADGVTDSSVGRDGVSTEQDKKKSKKELIDRLINKYIDTQQRDGYRKKLQKIFNKIQQLLNVTQKDRKHGDEDKKHKNEAASIRAFKSAQWPANRSEQVQDQKKYVDKIKAFIETEIDVLESH